LTLIDIGDREQVRAAGMTIFVRRRDEVPVYDEVFTRFWQRYELAIEPMPLDLKVEAGDGEHQQVAEVTAGDNGESEVIRAEAPGADDGSDADAGVAVDEAAGSMSWSERERLLHKPFDRMSPDELRDAERLVDDLRPRLEQRRSRRHELHRHGRQVATRQMFPRQPPTWRRHGRLAVAAPGHATAVDHRHL
jgi:uncharacterized protein with von Willebrand factor type A (vWA) domain